VETDGGVRSAAAQRQAEGSAVIGTAVTDGVRHRREHGGVRRRTIEVHESGNSTHQ
jgi:hypothetical protein